jgi:hypothetical protein
MDKVAVPVCGRSRRVTSHDDADAAPNPFRDGVRDLLHASPTQGGSFRPWLGCGPHNTRRKRQLFSVPVSPALSSTTFKTQLPLIDVPLKAASSDAGVSGRIRRGLDGRRRAVVERQVHPVAALIDVGEQEQKGRPGARSRHHERGGDAADEARKTAST